MARVLGALLVASERAACIARSCCSSSGSDSLLIAEKGAEEANARFDKDFKTIADVLAQEAAKIEIAARCPEMAKNVRGEECAEIGGVEIKLHETPEETAAMLCSLVPSATAKSMAEAAHCNIKAPCEIPSDLPDLDSVELGVWIDPIDATTEFIAGVRGDSDAEHGLPCVTVLIGAYILATGEPVVGVVNQPFYNNGAGRIIWGLSYKQHKKFGGFDVETSEKKTVLMSSSETPVIVEKFKALGWEVKAVAGAGHKLMKVALGEATAYVVSKGTTFRWDTCGPHAILCAQGGDISCYNTHKSITYNDPMNIDTQLYSNSGGIIAYGGIDILDEIIRIIS